MGVILGGTGTRPPTFWRVGETISNVPPHIFLTQVCHRFLWYISWFVIPVQVLTIGLPIIYSQYYWFVLTINPPWKTKVSNFECNYDYNYVSHDKGRELNSAATSATQPAAGHSWSFTIAIVIMTLGWGLILGLAAESCGRIWLPCLNKHRHESKSANNRLYRNII